MSGNDLPDFMNDGEPGHESPRDNAESLTLAEVARRTGISLPTLQRYRRFHGSRIPSVGEGRGQRYPVEAVDVFRRIRRESLERNSLPRPGGRLLTLTAQLRASQEAGRRTEKRRGESERVPEPPRTGSGNGEASRTETDREAGSGDDALARRLGALEASQLRWEEEIRTLLRELDGPWIGSSGQLTVEGLDG
jgi:hypothetical protein